MTQQKTIAISLRSLCSNPDSQSMILKEASCMNGLLALINSDLDIEALIISLQALLFLSQHPSNRAILTQQPGLLLRLVKLTETSEEYNANSTLTNQVKLVAQQVIDNLQSYINQEDTNKPIQLSKPAAATASNFSSSAGSAYKGRYLFTVQLQINGITSATQREELEKQLVAQRGIVSVACNKSGLCSVYTKIQPQQSFVENLLSSITSINSNYKVELKTPLSDSIAENNENQQQKANLNNSSNLSLPAQPIKPTPNSLTSAANTPSKSITTHSSYESASLASRFAARQKKIEKQEIQQGAVKSILSSVSSYFW
jgi:hypothetical protein